MRKSHRFALASLALLALTYLLPAARADFIFDVSVDTSNLSSDPSLTGPFAIDFRLIQGDGSVINSALISNINLGGGAASGSPMLTGNASGDLASSIALNDNSSFFNDFNQGFTPGSTLSFHVDLTANVGMVTPDEFSFALLQSYGTPNVAEIPTGDPSGANTLLTVGITSSTPPVSTYGGVNLDQDPLTTTATSTPEPGTLVLSLLALGSLAAARGWKLWRKSAAILDERST
jgi:hypothetical protein